MKWLVSFMEYISGLWSKWAKDKRDREVEFERRKEARHIIKKDEMEKPVEWKYFKQEEVEGLLNDLVYKLDRAREFYGFPIVITSGFRTPDQNDMVGGVKDSEHITGKGVDIKAPLEPYLREKLTWALGAAGFHRMGVYSRHFHVGISHEHPNPAFWVGEYK